MRSLVCLGFAAALLSQLGGVPVTAQDVWDVSGFERHGTFGAGIPPTFVDDGTGPFGSPYYDFGGALALAEVPSDWGLGGDYSMSLWFEGYNIASLGTNAVIAGSYADGSVPGFGLYFQGSGGKQNTLTFYHVSVVSPFTYVAAGTEQNMGSGWHNATVVFDQGAGLSFYLDGTLEQFTPSTISGVSEFIKPFTVGGQDSPIRQSGISPVAWTRSWSTTVP